MTKSFAFAAAALAFLATASAAGAETSALMRPAYPSVSVSPIPTRLVSVDRPADELSRDSAVFGDAPAAISGQTPDALRFAWPDAAGFGPPKPR